MIGPSRFPVLDQFCREAEVPEPRARGMGFSSRRYPAIADFLEPFGPWSNRTVLDLGGGVGGLAVVLHERFGGTYDVSDFAPFPPKAGFDLTRFGIRRYLAADFSRSDGLDVLPRDYDAILFVEVLEHLLVDPVRFFRKVADHLAPQGLFLVTTPNQARLRNRLELLRGRSIREKDIFPEETGVAFGHVMEYTTSDLEGYARRAGFSPVATRIVQNPPGDPRDRKRRWGASLLNRPALRGLALGDDVMALFIRNGTRGAVPGPSDGPT
jgi:SAM-dependent methyltransferase